MAKATAHPLIKRKSNKKSYLTILAPAGTLFKATTQVATVKDKVDSTLEWDIHEQDVVNGKKAILVVLHGKRAVVRKSRGAATRAPTVVDPPDAGTLVITLSDPPTGVDPLVVDMPVQYVDDYD